MSRLFLFLIPAIIMAAEMSHKSIQETSSPRLITEIEKQCQLTPVKLDLCDHLGMGSCAPVYREIYNGERVAIKMVSLDAKAGSNHFDLLLGEILALKAIREAGAEAPLVLLRSPGCFVTGSGEKRYVALVTEIVEGIDLEYGLKVWKVGRKKDKMAPAQPYSEQVIAKVMAEVLAGLVFLHRNGWLHRDIKPANIMISNEGRVKLIDFGLARRGQFSNQRGASLGYAAPEFLLKLKHGAPLDCWCLATTAFELYKGRIPVAMIRDIRRNFMRYYDEGSLVKVMGEKLIPEIPKFLQFASPSLTDFILKTLQIDPEARPTAIDLVRHAFVVGNNIASEAELQALVKGFKDENKF